MSNQIPQRLLDLIKSDGIELQACEIECLNDPARYEEALDMIDDWEARCALSGYGRGEVADWLTQRDLNAGESYEPPPAPKQGAPKSLFSATSPAWRERLQKHVNQQGINVLEWEPWCACGEEILKIIALADQVAEAWADVKEEVYAAACHQMRVVVFG